MGVMIKDMEMPRNCRGCKYFRHGDVLLSTPPMYLDAICIILDKNIGHDLTKSRNYQYGDGMFSIAENERWNECPLREYEEGEHGSNN